MVVVVTPSDEDVNRLVSISVVATYAYTCSACSVIAGNHDVCLLHFSTSRVTD